MTRDKKLRLWDLNRGTSVRSMHDNSSESHVLKYLPGAMGSSSNVQLVASAASDGLVKVWNMSSWTCEKTFPADSNCVYALEWWPSSRLLVTGGHERSIKLWKVTSGVCRAILRGHDKWISALRMVGPDMLASGSGDKRVKLWSLTRQTYIVTLTGHADVVTALEVLVEEDALASASLDGTIMIWGLRNLTCVQQFRAHMSAVNSLQALGAGKFASASDDKLIKVWWLIDTRQPWKTLLGHMGPVRSLRFLPLAGGRLISGSEDKNVRVWAVVSGRSLRTLHGQSPVNAIELIPT